MRLVKRLFTLTFYTASFSIIYAQNPQNNPLLTRPVIRNTKWSSLSDTVIASAENLAYNERSWNDRTATIESFSYEILNITMNDKLPDVAVIGFATEESWDCYQNHYEDYTYDELANANVQQYYNTLGWNRENWEQGAAEPASEDKFYNQLSSAEKDAAFNVCFDQKEWDGVSLDPAPLIPGLTGFPCFSGETLVEVDGITGLIRMDELKIGDRVKSSHNNNEYSTVISFSHIDRDMEADFLQIKATGSVIPPIEISKDHMMYINDGNKIVRAKDVKIGDIITEGVIVNSIETIKRRGVYSPVTNSGDIIVSGLQASGYVALLKISPTFQHWAAHAIHAPLRLVCSFNLNFCKDEMYTDGISNYIVGIAKVVTVFSSRSYLVQYMATMVVVPGIIALYAVERILRDMVLLTSVIFIVILLSRNKKRKID